jgi:RNA polymerase sigma-70 factor (ECF subfamily)
MAPNERELVKRILSGDEDAFRHFYDSHQKGVARVGWYFLGEDNEVSDILQETFIRALDNLKTFRFESTLATWLNHIAANLCRRALEKRKKSVPVDAQYFEPFVSRSQEGAYPPEAMEYLREEMDTLAGREGEMLRLRDRDGMAYEAIAGKLGLPMGSVTSSIHRARNKVVERVRQRLGITATDKAVT